MVTQLPLNWLCWSQGQGVLLLLLLSGCLLPKTPPNSSCIHLSPCTPPKPRPAACLDTDWSSSRLSAREGQGEKGLEGSSDPGIPSVGTSLSGCRERGERRRWEAERIKEQRNSSSWRFLILSSQGDFCSFQSWQAAAVQAAWLRHSFLSGQLLGSRRKALDWDEPAWAAQESSILLLT